jgi:hypothetical protein
MRKSFVLTAVLGGVVSVLAVLSTRAHSASPPRPPPGGATPADVGHDVGAKLAPPDETPSAKPWFAERAFDGPPVSLTASDGSGLVLASMRASAVVEGPLAFTEMRLAFDNPENRVREGTFKIVLPQGASLGRFAMKIGDAWQEGEVVPKERARVAYEDALHRKQDPALLEQGAGNEFTARVFPIPAHGRKDIVVSYAQELVGGAPYALPLRGLPELGVLDVSVGGEGVTPERLHREHTVPAADFVMESRKRPMPGALRAGDLVVARVKPVAEAMPEPVEKAIVLVDTSASRALGLAGELRAVQALLQGLAARHAGGLPVTVAAFDQEVAPIFTGDAGAFGQAEIDKLVGRRALGASNVEKALGWAKDEAKRTGATRVVLVTDGVPTAGETDGAKLAKAATALRDGGAERLDVVAVGGLRDDALAHKLVTAGLAHDGVVVAANDGADNMVRRLEAGTKSDVAVAVEGASWSYPTHLDGVQPGDEVLVYAELDPGAPVRVKLAGSDARTYDALPVERPLVERAWAQAKIASLEAEERDHGASAELAAKIVAMSTSHRVVSKYTAFLVLETDADYARFHIDRRALGDILTVNDGQLAWAKRGDLPGPFGALQPKTATLAQDKDGRLARAGGGAPSAPVAASAPPRPDMEMEKAESMDGIGDAFGAGGLGLSGAGQGGGGRGEGIGMGHAAAAAPRVASESSAMRFAVAGPADAPAPAATGEGGTGTRARGEEGSMGNPSTSPPMRRADVPAVDLNGAGSAPRPQAIAATPAPGPQGMGLLAAMGGSGNAQDVGGLDPYVGKLKTVKDKLAAGDKAGAFSAASAWQASEPGDVLALVSLGETAEAKGDPSLASRAYGSIIDLFPARADLRRFAGERLEHVKSKDAGDLAIDTFDKARKDRPDHPASHRLAAFARVRRGEYAAAFDILVAGIAQHYPEGRFRGVDRILREDLGLVAAAWIHAEPSRKSEIMARLDKAGGSAETGPSIRFVLNWETDANDVDFHIHDSMGGHAFYSQPHLASGGDLYADVTTGYGPECFTIRLPKDERATPYTLQAHYYSRGPMGYGMGKLEIIDHDGHGGLKFEERPFVVMVDHAFVDLGTVR